jgi:hypothetical protein
VIDSTVDFRATKSHRADALYAAPGVAERITAFVERAALSSPLI